MFKKMLSLLASLVLVFLNIQIVFAEENIEQKEVFATGISLSKGEIRLNCGESEIIEVMLVPENSVDVVEWLPTNKNVAYVVGTSSKRVRIVADREGEAKILVFTQDGAHFAECTVIVSHSFTNENVSECYFVSAATCTESEKYYKSCNCGAVGTETFDYGEPLGHVWDDGEITKYPSYSEDGVYTYTCKNIFEGKEHYKTQTIPALVAEKENTEIVEGPDPNKEYRVDYQDGLIIVPENLEEEYPAPEYVEEAFKENIAEGDLNQEEIKIVVGEVTVGYFDENEVFVPATEEFFSDGRKLQITLDYPEGADNNDKFEIYHLNSKTGNIDQLDIIEKNNNGIVVEVDCLSPFAIAFESVENSNLPILPNRPSNKPGLGITNIIPADEKEENNPDTGAPIFSFGFSGITALALTFVVIGKFKK